MTQRLKPIILIRRTYMTGQERKEAGLEERRKIPSEPVTINREIPLWGVITLVTTGVVFGASTFITQYYGQKELFSLVRAQTAQITVLSKQIEVLVANMQTKDLKDLEHDIRLNDLTRRLGAVEAKKITFTEGEVK